MDELELHGSINIRSYWPRLPLFATLKVNADELQIIKMVGPKNYTFKKEDVIIIKRVVEIPIIGWGIKIVHNIDSYPDLLIFWSRRNPKKLIDQIIKVGRMGYLVAHR